MTAANGGTLQKLANIKKLIEPQPLPDLDEDGTVHSPDQAKAQMINFCRLSVLAVIQTPICQALHSLC